ncbi:single-strand binding protein [Bordetella ansorpii]|uniref:Single-stranded DNA-binding protein n=1 Tax=Bordetella ansorpii TaxID=288768 RepID=A0A157SR46_9BORD|nr:single-stranded DNA-binding protein [Bordetella ansorpii]SAI72939.1 single-strand binding protein [Bordetella ansorpii]
MNYESINHIHVVGELDRDPEVRRQQNGQFVTTVMVKTTDHYIKTKTKEKVEEHTVHRAVLFYDNADTARKLKAGDVVDIEGTLKKRSYQDRNTGETKFSTQISASSLKVMSGTRGNSKTVDDPFASAAEFEIPW